MKDFFILELFRTEMDKTDLVEGTKVRYYEAVKKFLFSSPELNNPDSYKNFLVKYVRASANEDIKKEEDKRKRMNFYDAGLKRFVKFHIEDAKLKKEILDAFPKVSKNLPVKTRTYVSMKGRMKIVNGMEFEKHKVIALIMMCTGIRIGDCLKLERGKIVEEEYKDSKTLKLDVTGKRGKQNICHIHVPWIIDRILKFINTYDYGNGYYFLQSKFEDTTKGTKYVRNKYAKKRNRYIKVLKPNVFKVNGKYKNPGDIVDLKKAYLLSKEKIKLLLRDAFDNDEVIFCMPHSGDIINLFNVVGYNYNRFWVDLRASMNKLGLDGSEYSPHSFRKCYAQDIWTKDMDIHKLKKMLNHSDVNTTLKYLDSSGVRRLDEDKKAQSELDGMEPVN